MDTFVNNPDIEEQEKPSSELNLTKEETELFEDIKNGSVSEGDIQKLIDANIINENLLSKFLKKIQNQSASVKKLKPNSKESFDNDIEPFTNYSSDYLSTFR